MSFSQSQIELGLRYDGLSKHLRAINKGVVPSKGNNLPTNEITAVTTTLKAHPIWQNLTQALNQIDPAQVDLQHLKDCQAEVHGYWDDNYT